MCANVKAGSNTASDPVPNLLVNPAYISQHHRLSLLLSLLNTEHYQHEQSLTLLGPLITIKTENTFQNMIERLVDPTQFLKLNPCHG